MAKSKIDGYIDIIGNYFNNIPSLPKEGRDFIAAVLPWYALVVGIWGIIRFVSALGIFSGFSVYLYIGGISESNIELIMLILRLISTVLLLMAFPKLQKRDEKGWKLVYYSTVVGLIGNILVFSLVELFITLIAFYLLYQVKSYYK